VVGLASVQNYLDSASVGVQNGPVLGLESDYESVIDSVPGVVVGTLMVGLASVQADYALVVVDNKPVMDLATFQYLELDSNSVSDSVPGAGVGKTPVIGLASVQKYLGSDYVSDSPSVVVQNERWLGIAWLERPEQIDVVREKQHVLGLVPLELIKTVDT
jgi:hypothetical protein